MKAPPRVVLATIASAVTLVGGHLVNRRWDRAALFLAVLTLWYYSAYLLWPLLGVSTDAEGVPDMTAGIRRMGYVYAAGFAAVWLASILVTLRDAGRAPAGTLAQRLGAVIVSVAGLALLVSAATTSVGYIGWDPDAVKITSLGDAEPAYEPQQPALRSSLHFGGARGRWYQYPPPPSGPARLVVRVMHDGRPAAGVRLELVLNGRYKTAPLTSDASGNVVAPLAPGQWSINVINPVGWRDAPPGRYVLVSGHEQPLTEEYYGPHGGPSDGLEVKISETATAPAMTLTIRPQITLLWPQQPGQAADPTSDRVAWETHPDATDYLVRLDRVTRHGRTTSYEPAISRRVRAATALALSDLPTTRGGAGSNEYQVTVYAFDRDGRFLSESEHLLDRYRFRLPEGTAFMGREPVAVVPGAAADDATGKEQVRIPAKVFAQLMKETQRKPGDPTRRLDAAETLIETGEPAAARRVLEKTTDPKLTARKNALLGYAFAVEGKCEEARQRFDAAASEGGRSCVEERYWGKCGRGGSAR
jgi:hypothetical protein